MVINNIVSGISEVSVIHTQKHGLSKPSGPRTIPTIPLGFQEGVSMEKGRDDSGTNIVRVLEVGGGRLQMKPLPSCTFCRWRCCGWAMPSAIPDNQWCTGGACTGTKILGCFWVCPVCWGQKKCFFGCCYHCRLVSHVQLFFYAMDHRLPGSSVHGIS